MGGIVGVGVALPHLHKVQNAADQFALVGRRGEVNDGGGAAPDCAQGVLQGAGIGHAGDLLVRARLHVGGGVDVGLNSTGADDAPGGVHSLPRLVNEGAGRADGDDAAILHADVHGGGLAGHNNGSAGNQQVKHFQPSRKVWQARGATKWSAGPRFARLRAQLADSFLGGLQRVFGKLAGGALLGQRSLNGLPGFF